MCILVFAVNMDIISTEPYRIWEYYNQQCSLSQAFDLEINNKGVRDLPAPTLNLSKDELLFGRQSQPYQLPSNQTKPLHRRCASALNPAIGLTLHRLIWRNQPKALREAIQAPIAGHRHDEGPTQRVDQGKIWRDPDHQAANYIHSNPRQAVPNPSHLQPANPRAGFQSYWALPISNHSAPGPTCQAEEAVQLSSQLAAAEIDAPKPTRYTTTAPQPLPVVEMG